MNQMNQMNQANPNNRYYPVNRGYQPNQTPCSCRQNSVLNSMSQAQLLNYINEVSFAVSDILLFLDTHPCDCEALAYCREMVAKRNEALKVYSMRFGPLTIDCTDLCDSNRWEWIMQPFPWESKCKGGCR